jgi:cytoskeletal protein RodZ
MAHADGILGLVRIRQSRGISLERIADETKISIRSLKAIESGEFAKLPGGIYNTSYIRQYCQAIDFDESILLGYYYRATGTQPSREHADAPAALQRYLQTLRPAPAGS